MTNKLDTLPFGPFGVADHVWIYRGLPPPAMVCPPLRGSVKMAGRIIGGDITSKSHCPQKTNIHYQTILQVVFLSCKSFFYLYILIIIRTFVCEEVIETAICMEHDGALPEQRSRFDPYRHLFTFSTML